MTLLIYRIKPLHSISHPPSCIVPKVHCTVLLAHVVGSDPLHIIIPKYDYMNDCMYDYMKGVTNCECGNSFPHVVFPHGFQCQKEKNMTPLV